MSIRDRLRREMERGGGIRRPPPLRADWEELAARMIPAGAPANQARDMKGSFYAGAYAVMQYMVWMSYPEVSDDAGLAALDEIGEEMLDYFHEIGAAGIPHPFRASRGATYRDRGDKS